MTETIQTTSGTNRTTETKAGGARWLTLGGLVGLCLLLIAGLEYRSLQHVTQLEGTLAEARPSSFLVGLQLREAIEELSGSLLRFELSSDPSERIRFEARGRELAERLGRARYSLLTEREQQLAQSAATQLDQFLNDATPILAEGRRSIRRETAEEVHQVVRGLTAPLLDLANQLVKVQEDVASGFFADAQGALRSLRHWLLGSLLLFLLLLGAIILLSYRTLVTPLQLRLTESQAIIERQERLASLGVLTAGIAHEIRNPLAAIKFRLYSLRRSLPPSPSGHEDLTVIDDEIQRLDRILKDFLQFARPSEPDFRTVLVPQLLAGLQNLLKESLHRQGLRLEVVPGEALSVRADPQQLQQVLINLVQNAAEATKAGGVITLSARAGAARRARRSEPVVMVEVSDSGRGLTAKEGQRIFDPFFSTKDGGTGLGLPMAARLVEMQGGFLQYASQTDRGSTFTIVLPRDNHEPS